MSLEITTNINVDFYDNEYIMINAKQYDNSSRIISITCYGNGKLFNLNASKHVAYVSYKKADGNVVFNTCTIDYKGKVLVELTEQMLSVSGVCEASLIVINKGSAKVNIDTGEIIAVDNTPILSTMAFYVNVCEAPVDNSLIESVYEYEPNTLNQLLIEANANYSEAYKLAKSWAIGQTGIRDGEDTDNSKYYYEQSFANAKAASDSEEAASESAERANARAVDASGSQSAAAISKAEALYYSEVSQSYAVGGIGKRENEDSDNAKYYYEQSSINANSADESKKAAKVSEESAKLSEESASDSKDKASTSEGNAKISENNAADSANLARSYATGDTGTRENEHLNNAKYYYERTRDIFVGVDKPFIPMGTVSFADLANVEKVIGYMYNIKDDFTTDSSFAEGEGLSYTAGVNVYCRSDGLWDTFGGAASPTADVEDVKSYLGI